MQTKACVLSSAPDFTINSGSHKADFFVCFGRQDVPVSLQQKDSGQARRSICVRWEKFKEP